MQKQSKKLTNYLGVLLKMVSYLEKKINNPSAQITLDLASFFPIYSERRAGAKSLSQSRGSVFNVQNRASNSWTTGKFSPFPRIFHLPLMPLQIVHFILKSCRSCLSLQLYPYVHKSFGKSQNKSVQGVRTASVGHEREKIPRYWPRNFFGGLARSPASGWTTHRSSTNLEKQKLSHSLKHATNVYKCTDTPATPQIQKLPHFSSVIQKNTLEILLLSITKKVYIFLPERGFLSTKLRSVFQTPLHLNPVKIAFVTSYTLMFHVKFMFSFIRAINPQSERVCFSAAVRFSSSPFPIFFLWGGMWN